MDIETLNRIYKPLYNHTKELITLLKTYHYEYKWGYYGQHYFRQEGEWQLEYYPIPVITIKNICDIGFDLTHTFIECKLSREAALELDYGVFKQYKFEVYGVGDYLNDFYNDKLLIDKVHDRIRGSKEQEIGISIMLNYLEDNQHLLEVVAKLHNMGT